MTNQKNKPASWKNTLPWIASVLVVFLMVFSSELLSEKEIIFPEITALAVGYITAPKRAWQVNNLRLWILITLCAVLGVLIVLYVPAALWIQLTLAFSIGQIILLSSRTSMAPLLSAIVLPVMLQTDTWIYPIAAGALTAIIILLRRILIALSLRKEEPFRPLEKPEQKDIADMVLRIFIAAVAFYFLVPLNLKFMVAPPLLVAFTEFTKVTASARKKPVQIVALITACAGVGSACRYLLTMALGLPLSVAATTAAILMLLLVWKSKLYVPPAGAITILAMIVPESSVLMFPVQIFFGTAMLMAIALGLFPEKRREM